MSFRSSLRFALTGVRYAFQHERNFRIHLCLGVLALALAAGLRISWVEWLFVVTAIASVLVLEIVNTIFELLVDLLQPRIHDYAGAIKDLTAAAVLIASVSALIVGVIIFLPRIFERIL